MVLLISPIKYTTVNYLKDTGVYAALHLACSPKSCLLVYSYKRTSLADGISDRVPLVLHNFFARQTLLHLSCWK